MSPPIFNIKDNAITYFLSSFHGPSTVCLSLKLFIGEKTFQSIQKDRLTVLSEKININ